MATIYNKECLFCHAKFETDNKDKKFCETKCKDSHHNRAKMNGIKLWPQNMDEMKSYANEWETTIENVVNIFIWKGTNPDGKNISEADAHGK